MASSSKTGFLKLNQWVGTDVPKRQDFVNDNQIVDQAMSAHVNNGEIHLSETDRVKINSLFFTGLYTGNSEATRVIQLGESPSFVIVYPLSYPMSKTEFQGEVHWNNFGFCTQGTGSYGLSLREAELTVRQNTAVEFMYEILRFNQSGVTYQYIAFR